LKTSNSYRPTVSQIEEELKRRRNIGKIRRTMRNIIISLVVVASATILIAMLWMPVMQVHGTSMEPVLSDGEILVAVRGQRYIQHGDIMAFYYNNQVLLKRAIGLPGDVIDIDKEGNVFVNGELLDEPYISKKAFGICDIEMPVTVPENSIFVLGDRRAVSVDSRSSDVGMIYSERTIGKIVFRVWEFESFGPV
jgi:signal peptidase I